MQPPDVVETRRSGVSAEEARAQPAYQQAKQIQRAAMISFPATLLIGGFLVWTTMAVWVTKVWFTALGLHVAVFVGAQIRSVYVFARHIRRQVRELVAASAAHASGPDSADSGD